MKNLWPSSLLVLLVPTLACTKPNFVSTSPDAGGAGGVADSATGPEVSVTCPEPNLACSASGTTGTCDPVCQTGGCDWCSQKCTYAFDGVAAQPACASAGQKAFPELCSATSAGLPGQSDDCAPGSICLLPVSGGTSWYCFNLCRIKEDCPTGVECGERSLFPQGVSVKVCDPFYDQCGPDGTCCKPLLGTGCAANRFCYLVSPDLGTGHSRTVCEFNTGAGRNASFCSSSRDCMTANTCVNGGCRRVCNDTNLCPGGGTCTKAGGEYGYCPY